jgi:hypothetical protein
MSSFPRHAEGLEAAPREASFTSQAGVSPAFPGPGRAAPPPVPDPDAPLRAALARHRAIATGLLVFMAAVMLGSYWLPPGYWTDLLQAAPRPAWWAASPTGSR